MIKSQDIKKGTCIRMDGKLYFCIDFLHVKPGKGNTIMRTTLKDVVSGRVLEKRFNIGEALEDVRVERRPYQYLYQEGADYIFMNQETFDQIPIAKDLITGVDFMKESDIVAVLTELVEVMNDQLQNSMIVKLDGFGTFRMGMKSAPADSAKDWTVLKNVRGLHVNFIPQGSRNVANGNFERTFLKNVKIQEAADYTKPEKVQDQQ